MLFIHIFIYLCPLLISPMQDSKEIPIELCEIIQQINYSRLVSQGRSTKTNFKSDLHETVPYTVINYRMVAT